VEPPPRALPARPTGARAAFDSPALRGVALMFVSTFWVTAIAYLAFAEHLDLYTGIGGAVIFASTLYIAYRERAAQTQT
jgi:drug/metabolite transporter (DMT)-like permease